MPIYIERLPISASGGSPKCRLYLWGEDSRAPVYEFLINLNKSRPHDFKRLQALFVKMVGAGKISNKESFKDVDGHKPLFEFKGHGVRVYCFRDGNDWILVEGDDAKKSDDSKNRNRACIDRAQGRVSLYWQEKKAGRLEVKE